MANKAKRIIQPRPRRQKLEAILASQGIENPHPADVVAYLASHRDLAKIVPFVCEQARREFGPEAELILTMLNEQARTRYISPYDIAVIHAGLGDRAAALAKLEEAYEDRSAWMVFIDVDPRLDSLREEPTFAELAARLN